MFDKNMLSILIKKAQGDKSLNQFALHCKLDPGNLSRILNKKNNQPPKPESLKKIAEHAYNNVTYEELMIASGHITDIKETDINSTNNQNKKDIGKIIDELKTNLKENRNDYVFYDKELSLETIQCILDTLEFGIRQAKIINKKI